MIIPTPIQERRDFPPEIPNNVLSRLKKRTTFNGECWLFSGVNARGHGQLSYDGRTWGIHRLVAHFCYGLDLNDTKQQANHKVQCPNRNCWNPEHIYVGTQSENLKDAVEVGTYISPKAGKTRCPKGHPYAGDNLIIRKDGGRDCRTCNKERSQEFYKQQHRRIATPTTTNSGE